MEPRTTARDLAQQFLAAGDPTGWFEALYASAGGDASAIPWGDLRPNPNLTQWLDAHPLPPGLRAMVVGCGLGDDAQELARRGMKVTAFDVAPTAIEWCRRRFGDTAVTYVVGDVLAPPAAWRGAFDFVLESYTLQALPPGPRAKAARNVADFLAPSGRLLVICRGRNPGDAEGSLPWPLTRGELAKFVEECGLVEESFEDYVEAEDPPVRRFRCVFRRPSDSLSARGTVREIYVAPGAKAEPVAVAEVRAVAGRGLEGDRYFAGVGSFSRWPGEGRALTLIEQEAIDAVAREHGIELGDGRSRRNVVTSGVALSELIGKRFRIGEALLRGVRPAAPCAHLERLAGPGVMDAMKGRGGLRADVLEGGIVRVGDAVVPVAP
jgi:SAM-dependent methyltransferase